MHLDVLQWAWEPGKENGMGLDMYLELKRSEGGARVAGEYAMPGPMEDLLERCAEIGGGEAVEAETTVATTAQVAYWRKANAIHGWFIDNCGGGVDDCSTMEVSREQLGALLVAVKAVLANHSLAEEILPTREGFFFGSEEYDEDYFAQLGYTEEVLVELTGFLDAVAEGKTMDDEGRYTVTYQASW